MVREEIPHDSFFVQRDSLLLSSPPHVREASFAVLDALYSLTDQLRQLPERNWEQILTRMLYHHEETANDWAGSKFMAQIQPGFNPFEQFQLANALLRSSSPEGLGSEILTNHR